MKTVRFNRVVGISWINVTKYHQPSDHEIVMKLLKLSAVS